MSGRKDQKETGREEAKDGKNTASPEHAGSKPRNGRLTDEQAHAELRRRQRERRS